VGDTLRFGQSSRLFLLCGPEELLPEEGLTRSQKAQLAQLEYAQHMKERDLKVRWLPGAEPAWLHAGGLHEFSWALVGWLG